MEAGTLAESHGEIKAEGEGTHSETKISGERPPSEGVHRRRRHFPGRPLAALGFRTRSRSARSLPGAAHRESVAVHVFLTLRRQETKQKSPRRNRNARARIVARNAGAGRRLETCVPAD